jgi:hypothetical protein
MKKNISEKMVCVAGVYVTADKVEGRLQALANGRRIAAAKNASLNETRKDEIRELKDAGWTDAEITQKFLLEEAETAKSHGFIHPTPRTYRAPKVPFGGGVMFH